MKLLPMALALALLCLAQQPGLPSLGSSVAALSLRTRDGAPVRLDTLADPSPVLLVALPAANPAALCQWMAELAALPSPSPVQRMALVADTTALNACTGASSVLVVTGGWAPSSSHSTHSAESLTAIVIDDSLHVRLLQTVPPDAPGWQTLGAKLAQWFQGRQTYEANCGHCHGFDGAQASAPETKSLVGITRKYPEAKVLALGALFGGVDMTGWSDAKKEILLTYLRGL